MLGDYSDIIPTRPGHYVYRLWADDVPLYVGCVGERGPRRVTHRLASHKREKPWWPQVTHIDVAAFASIEEVVAEETAQIAALKPVHNKQLLDGRHDVDHVSPRIRGNRRQYELLRQQRPGHRWHKQELENTRRRRQGGRGKRWQQPGPSLFD